MALCLVQAIHTGIMWADYGLVPTEAFIENLSNRAACIEPIAIIPDIPLFLLTVCECLVHIATRCDPLAHDSIPEILQEIRTTI